MRNDTNTFAFALIIATGAMIVGGLAGVARADVVPIKVVEDVVENAAYGNPQGESINYSGTLTENNQDPTMLYVLFGVKRNAIVGGVQNNPTNPFLPKSHISGFFNKEDSNWYGLNPGETPDSWFGGRDLDGDGLVGYKDQSTGIIAWDYSAEFGSEYISPESGQIQVSNFTPYPVSGTGNVDINVIPEPCTLGLFVLGGMAVALKRARRKTSR